MVCFRAHIARFPRGFRRRWLNQVGRNIFSTTIDSPLGNRAGIPALVSPDLGITVLGEMLFAQTAGKCVARKEIAILRLRAMIEGEVWLYDLIVPVSCIRISRNISPLSAIIGWRSIEGDFDVEFEPGGSHMCFHPKDNRRCRKSPYRPMDLEADILAR